MSVGAPADLSRLRDLVERSLGLRVDDDSRLESLAAFVTQRATQRGEPIAAYIDRLASRHDANELRALAGALTVGETYFFRNAEQFRALAEIVLPERAERRGGAHVRILSAGCSSGDEAYTLAIAARRPWSTVDWPVEIRAIDVNADALQRAARARYSPWAMRETTPDIEARWFRREGSELMLDSSIREAVRFEERNLVDANAATWGADAYDVIFCRNVTMYFAPAQARAVIRRFARALAPRGYLFLGHAETLRGLSNDFHLRHTHGAFYYQRRDELAELSDEELVAAPASIALRADAAPPHADTAWLDTIQHSADRIRALSERVLPRRTSPPPVAPSSGRTLELIEHERYAEALVDLEGGDPLASDPDRLLVRAALLTHSGRIDDAEHACQRLLAVEELSAGAHYLLALCREMRGDARAAADHDQVAVYLDPSFAMPRLHLGLIARRAGDADGARRELSQAALLLSREDPGRLLLFGGGFTREALMAMCESSSSSSRGKR